MVWESKETVEDRDSTADSPRVAGEGTTE
jgi:hypothetical protein